MDGKRAYPRTDHVVVATAPLEQPSLGKCYSCRCFRATSVFRSNFRDLQGSLEEKIPNPNSLNCFPREPRFSIRLDIYTYRHGGLRREAREYPQCAADIKEIRSPYKSLLTRISRLIDCVRIAAGPLPRHPSAGGRPGQDDHFSHR